MDVRSSLALNVCTLESLQRTMGLLETFGHGLRFTEPWLDSSRDLVREAHTPYRTANDERAFSPAISGVQPCVEGRRDFLGDYYGWHLAGIMGLRACEVPAQTGVRLGKG